MSFSADPNYSSNNCFQYILFYIHKIEEKDIFFKVLIISRMNRCGTVPPVVHGYRRDYRFENSGSSSERRQAGRLPLGRHVPCDRSEERRVGKEGRSRWSP